MRRDAGRNLGTEDGLPPRPAAPRSPTAIMATQISKKKKFVADGVLYAELNELLTRELAEEGYSGVEVRVTPSKTEVVIRATRTQSVLGEKGRRIRELTSVVQKRFGFPENSVELFVEKVANRGLCAIAQAESLRYKLVGGLAVRRACYGVLRYGALCTAVACAGLFVRSRAVPRADRNSTVSCALPVARQFIACGSCLASLCAPQ